jgi:hypothetical protein
MQQIAPLDLITRQQLVPTDFREYGARPVIGLGARPKRKRCDAEPVSEAVRNLLKEGMKTMGRGYKKPRAERKYGGALKVAGGSLASEMVKVIGPHLGAFIIDRLGRVFDKAVSGMGVMGGASAPKLKQVGTKLNRLLKTQKQTVNDFARVASQSHADAIANLYLDPYEYGKRTRTVGKRKAEEHIAKLSALAQNLADAMHAGTEKLVALLAEGSEDGAFIDELSDRLQTELERVQEERQFLDVAYDDKMEDYEEDKREERAEKARERRANASSRPRRPITAKQSAALAAGRAKRAAQRAQ